MDDFSQYLIFNKRWIGCTRRAHKRATYREWLKQNAEHQNHLPVHFGCVLVQKRKLMTKMHHYG